jgi:predicted GNAT superfamily acetyltransferase
MTNVINGPGVKKNGGHKGIRMKVSISYEELTDPGYIPECVSLHKKIFGLSDADAFPPAFFHLLMREGHPLGMVIGCFRQEGGNKYMIGIVAAMADRADKSLYCAFLGILPEYQNKRYGYDLFMKFYETALEKNIEKLFGIFDPLEANLGKLYMHVGGKAIKYFTEPYHLSLIHSTPDKVLYEWGIQHYTPSQPQLVYAKAGYGPIPIAEDLSLDALDIMIQIPLDYMAMKEKDPEKATIWRLQTRKLFSHYINEKGYEMVATFLDKRGGQRQLFYILHKS